MSRPLRKGDRVQATGTVTNIYGDNGGIISVRFDGAAEDNGIYTRDRAALTLIAPVEPPVGSVVVKDGRAWQRIVDAGSCWFASGRAYAKWDDISDGAIIFTPGGDSDVG